MNFVTTAHHNATHIAGPHIDWAGLSPIVALAVGALVVLLAGLGAWQARIHAASVAAARRPAARRVPEYSQPR